VYLLFENVNRFRDKRPHGGSTRLVARRNHFDHCNDDIAADVPNGYDFLLAAIKSEVRLRNGMKSWRRKRGTPGSRATRFFRRVCLTINLKR
jgi:hypothetical protein